MHAAVQTFEEITIRTFIAPIPRFLLSFHFSSSSPPYHVSLHPRPPRPGQKSLMDGWMDGWWHTCKGEAQMKREREIIASPGESRPKWLRAQAYGDIFFQGINIISVALFFFLSL